MKYWARTGLLVVLLPLLAMSASAQVWVPGNPAPNQSPPQAQTVPAQPPTDLQPVESPVVLPVKDKESRLSPETRLELIRYVSGEFAKAKTSLPGGKKGFRVDVGQPLDQRALMAALKDGGVAASPGDDVQITRLEFGGSDIMIEINGGGNMRKSWLEHIQISGGTSGAPVSTSTTVNDDYGPAPAAARPGITLKLDFGRPLPEMTPDELKVYLSSVLDFSNRRSAAVRWAEAQPPEIREAIAAKRAVAGMDPDQVVAALGRAERKVRERQQDGTETEDWIYGQPPGKTIFVRFAHDKVISVTQYPLPVPGATE
jgi:hypothetical protein